ncbi:MAG: hypothetical protein JSR78_20405 [Proteobacteria bacterium]|nr:hypothetical protein [Pseudomonadota bacterium]
MSAVAVGAAGVVIVTAATVLAAAFPDTQALLLPLTEGGSEFAVPAASVLASLPILGIMAVLAISGRE